MIAEHPLATADPALARALSARVTSSVAAGTVRTYSSGFNSLKQFAAPLGLPFLPTDKVTLGAWLHHEVSKSKPTKMASLKKYMSGVRWEHLVNGLSWDFAGDEWLELVKHSIRKDFPATPFLKVPMTEHLLRQLAECLPGWPVAARMAFDDHLWLCAASIGLFACLRGGEFAQRGGSSRPLLVGEDVILQERPTRGVVLRIRKPKTQPGLAYQITLANDCEVLPDYPLNPSALLRSYRHRARRRGIEVLGQSAAFKGADGATMTLKFLLDKAAKLSKAAGVSFVDLDEMPIPFRAASFRAGHVLSARMGRVPEAQIRATGRWASDGGPAPYSMTSEEAFASSSAAIVAAGASAQRSKVYRMGAFSSSLAVFQATEGWDGPQGVDVRA